MFCAGVVAAFFVWRSYFAWRHGWLVLDWAVFHDVLAQLAQGQAPRTLWESFAQPVNHFGVHGHWILIPLAILARLAPASMLLPLLLAIVFAGIAWSVFLLYRLADAGQAPPTDTEPGQAPRLRNRRAWLIGGILLFYLPVWSQGAPGFHPESLALPGLIGFAYFLLYGRSAGRTQGSPLQLDGRGAGRPQGSPLQLDGRGAGRTQGSPLHGNTGMAAACGLLAAGCREEAGLTLVLLAAGMYATEPDRRRAIVGAALPGAALSFIGAVVVQVLARRADDGGFAAQIIAARYDDFWAIFRNNPDTVFDDRVARLRFLFVIFAPLVPGFLLVGRRAWWLLAAAPGLLLNLDSTYQFQWSDGFYYQSIWLPVVLLVWAAGGRREEPSPTSPRDGEGLPDPGHSQFAIRNSQFLLSALLLMPAIFLSSSLRYWTAGVISVPAVEKKTWRVADAELLRQMRDLEDLVPPRATLAIAGLGLAEYLRHSSMPLEGAVKNGLRPDYVLLRTDGDNFEARRGASQADLSQAMATDYRALAQRDRFALFVRRAQTN